MDKVYVHRRSGLLEPFEVPELTIDEAITRNWERRVAETLIKLAEWTGYPVADSGEKRAGGEAGDGDGRVDLAVVELEDDEEDDDD